MKGCNETVTVTVTEIGEDDPLRGLRWKVLLAVALFVTMRTSGLVT